MNTVTSSNTNSIRTRLLATGIALGCGAVLTAGAPGPPQMPSQAGIYVGNPADLPEEKKTNIFIKFGGIEGESYDINLDGSIDEDDLERMFDQMGSDEASGDLDGDGSVDGGDLAEMNMAIGFNRMLGGVLGFSW